jgi:flagellar biogenesis protein FliO
MAIFIPDETGELTALNQAAVAATEMAPQVPGGDLGAAFAKMFLTLIVIIALLLVSYWFLRKLIRHRLEKGVGNTAIHVLEKRMISPKTMLYLIEVDKKKILIAESHLEIKRLENFPES